MEVALEGKKKDDLRLCRWHVRIRLCHILIYKTIRILRSFLGCFQSTSSFFSAIIFYCIVLLEQPFVFVFQLLCEHCITWSNTLFYKKRQTVSYLMKQFVSASLDPSMGPSQFVCCTHSIHSVLFIYLFFRPPEKIHAQMWQAD